jgi:hypothetical protein
VDEEAVGEEVEDSREELRRALSLMSEELVEGEVASLWYLAVDIRVNEWPLLQGKMIVTFKHSHDHKYPENRTRSESS